MSRSCTRKLVIINYEVIYNWKYSLHVFCVIQVFTLNLQPILDLTFVIVITAVVELKVYNKYMEIFYSQNQFKNQLLYILLNSFIYIKVLIKILSERLLVWNRNLSELKMTPSDAIWVWYSLDFLIMSLKSRV